VRGDIHVVWAERRDSHWAIWHRYWQSAENRWGIPLPLTGFRHREQAPALLFDEAGNGHLVWTRRYLASEGGMSDGTDLVYRRWDGQSWSSEEIIHHESTYLSGPYGLVLVEEGNGIKLFVSYGLGFAQTEWSSGSWSPLSSWNWTLGIGIAAVVLDTKGNMHIAGYGENSGKQQWDEFFSDAYYAMYNGDDWSAPVNLSSVDGAAYDMDLAFDGDGRLHFVWSDQGSPYSSETTQSTVFERVLSDLQWSANQPVIQFNAGQGVLDLELKEDYAGGLHLAWSEGLLVDYAVTGLSIRYQWSSGNNWLQEEHVHAGPFGSWNLSMDADEDAVYLAWEEWPYGSEAIHFSTTRSDIEPPRIFGAWLPSLLNE
jgi:hypothetical protein